MCGRYFIDTLPELLAQQFNVIAHPSYAPSYNLAPTQNMLLLRAHGEQLNWAQVRWGLVPHWSKDAKGAARMINARSEGVAEKPAFRNAMRYRRCVIPASGFYEWQTTASGKQPFAIVPTDAASFGFAGLFEAWTAPDGSVLETGCILTTSPNSLMLPIHDRMPVILDPSQYEGWIRAPVADALRLVDSFPTERMRAYRVGRAVGNARNDYPALIAPEESLF